MTPDQYRQIQQALSNTRRPGRTHAAKVRDAMMHAKLSKTKPAACDEASGPMNNTKESSPDYDTRPRPS